MKMADALGVGPEGLDCMRTVTMQLRMAVGRMREEVGARYEPALCSGDGDGGGGCGARREEVTGSV